MNRMTVGVAVAAVCTVCCGCPTKPGGNSVAPVAAKPTTPAPSPPKPVQPDDLSFRRPILRERLQRLVQVAQETAGPNTLHEPWFETERSNTEQRWPGFTTRWRLLSADGTPVPPISLDLRPYQSIGVTAEINASQEVAELRLSARSQRDAETWGADVFYHIPPEQFAIQLLHDQLAKRPNAPVLSFPIDTFKCVKKYGRTDCFIIASGIQQRPSDLPEFLASPESFRDFSLSILDQSEPLVREKIASGDALISVTDHDKLVTETREGPGKRPQIYEVQVPQKFKRPLPPEYALTEPRKEKLLAEMHAEYDRRRELLREHYQEMYAAVQRAFPLQKLLDGENN